MEKSLKERIAAGVSEKAVEKIIALGKAAVVRRQVRVKIEGQGIVSLRIRPKLKNEPLIIDEKTSVGQIQAKIQDGATYDRLKVLGGASSGNIISTNDSEKVVSPIDLADSAQAESVVINGGYYVYRQGLQTDTGEVIKEIGRPVGPTHARADEIPIPGPWRDYYGQVTVGGEAGVSSGPLLTLNGVPQNIPDDDRFKYRLGDAATDNPLNKMAGSLTHASEPNERSAISVVGDNVFMHSLTAKGRRSSGATMRQWQTITEIGVNSKGESKGSTLNLDGGGTIFMGIRDKNGTRLISRGGEPSECFRPITSIISSQKGIVGSRAAEHAGKSEGHEEEMTSQERLPISLAMSNPEKDESDGVSSIAVEIKDDLKDDKAIESKDELEQVGSARLLVTNNSMKMDAMKIAKLPENYEPNKRSRSYFEGGSSNLPKGPATKKHTPSI